MGYTMGVVGIGVALSLVPGVAAAQQVVQPAQEANPWVMGLSGAATGALAGTALGLPLALSSKGEISAAVFGMAGAGVGMLFGTPLGVTLAGRHYGAPVSYGRALLGTSLGMLGGFAVGMAVSSAADYSTPSLVLGLGLTLLGGTAGAVWMTPRAVPQPVTQARRSWWLTPTVAALPQGASVGVVGRF
jgi:hypothetical protein